MTFCVAENANFFIAISNCKHWSVGRMSSRRSHTLGSLIVINKKKERQYENHVPKNS